MAKTEKLDSGFRLNRRLSKDNRIDPEKDPELPKDKDPVCVKPPEVEPRFHRTSGWG